MASWSSSGAHILSALRAERHPQTSGFGRGLAANPASVGTGQDAVLSVSARGLDSCSATRSRAEGGPAGVVALAECEGGCVCRGCAFGLGPSFGHSGVSKNGYTTTTAMTSPTRATTRAYPSSLLVRCSLLGGVALGLLSQYDVAARAWSTRSNRPVSAAGGTRSR